MQSEFLDNVSSGTVGYANDSGWNHPVLLLMDNHASHLSVDALDMAVANGVHITFMLL